MPVDVKRLRELAEKATPGPGRTFSTLSLTSFSAAANPSTVLALLDEIERKDRALREIADGHLPDQPAALNVPDEVWAQQWIGRLRSVARAALSPATPMEEA